MSSFCTSGVDRYSREHTCVLVLASTLGSVCVLVLVSTFRNVCVLVLVSTLRSFCVGSGINTWQVLHMCLIHLSVGVIN